jgi:hypothetical protein
MLLGLLRMNLRVLYEFPSIRTLAKSNLEFTILFGLEWKEMKEER